MRNPNKGSPLNSSIDIDEDDDKLMKSLVNKFELVQLDKSTMNKLEYIIYFDYGLEVNLFLK